MYNVFKPEQPVGLMDFVRAAKSCITEIAPAELKAKLDAKEDLLLIDVREPSEFEHGHIDGSHLVPRGIIEAAADTSYPKHYPPLSGARNRQIVLYCATSGRSAMAAAVLQMMGYKNVINLAGGIARWQDEGMPLVREAEY
jgi:rhodanese-related sulfurtransferase